MFYLFRSCKIPRYTYCFWGDSRRRGQRLADRKVDRFWMRQSAPTGLVFETVGIERKSFANTNLIRKRCIGELKWKVL